MTVAAVSDAGPLIHLAAIDSLALFDAFERLFVPETVYGELERGGLPDGLADRSFELVEAPTDDEVQDGLDPGERAALAIAIALLVVGAVCLLAGFLVRTEVVR